MTPEELKKIAREVASKIEPKKGFGGESYWIRTSTEIIEKIAEDYCIVPKSKVIGLWNEINNDAKVNIENGFPDYAEFNKLQLPPLEILFSKELFNTTEK